MYAALPQTLKVWRSLYQEKPLAMWTAIIATVGSTFAALLIPSITGKILDSLSVLESSLLGVFQLVMLSTVMTGFDIASSRSTVRLGEDAVQRKRNRFAESVISLQAMHHRKFEPGDILSRMTSDTALIKYMCSKALTDSIRGVLMGAGSLVFLVVVNPSLFVVSFMPLAISSAIMFAAGHRLKRFRQLTQESVADLSSALQGALAGGRIFLAFGVGRYVEKRLREKIGDVRRASLAEGQLQSSVVPVSQAIGSLSLAVVFLVGGSQAVSGTISIGTLVSCVLYISYLIPSLMTVNQTWVALQQCVSSLVRVDEIGDIRVESVERGY